MVKIEYPYPVTIETARALMAQNPLAAWLNVDIVEVAPGLARGSLMVEAKHLAPNGFLHAAVVLGFADLMFGVGTAMLLPSNDYIFTTIELGSTFVSTAQSGQIVCLASNRHAGSKTQVWEAEVSAAETGKLMAVVRCIQVILENR